MRRPLFLPVAHAEPGTETLMAFLSGACEDGWGIVLTHIESFTCARFKGACGAGSRETCCKDDRFIRADVPAVAHQARLLLCGTGLFGLTAWLNRRSS
jgi:hypothetical protein